MCRRTDVTARRLCRRGGRSGVAGRSSVRPALPFFSRSPAESGSADAGAPLSGGQGAQLLRRLLPEQGAQFSLRQQGGEVVGRIVLNPPVIY